MMVPDRQVGQGYFFWRVHFSFVLVFRDLTSSLLSLADHHESKASQLWIQ